MAGIFICVPPYQKHGGMNSSAGGAIRRTSSGRKTLKLFFFVRRTSSQRLIAEEFMPPMIVNTLTTLKTNEPRMRSTEFGSAVLFRYSVLLSCIPEGMGRRIFSLL